MDRFAGLVLLLVAVLVFSQNQAHENKGITYAAQLIDPKYTGKVASILQNAFDRHGDMGVYRLLENLQELQENSDPRTAYARALNLKQAINMFLQQIGDPNARLDFVEGQDGEDLFMRRHNQLFGEVGLDSNVDLQLLQQLFN